MKVNVIKDKCIGCGNCVSLTESTVFDFDDEGLAETIVDIVPEDLEETAKMAIEQCPTEAIEEINEKEETAKMVIEQCSTEAIEEINEKEETAKMAIEQCPTEAIEEINEKEENNK